MKQTRKWMTTLTATVHHVSCVLNGIIGDHLESAKTPMAIKMQLCTATGPLLPTKNVLNNIQLPLTGKICILAHGSCSSERSWSFSDQAENNYGSLLQQDFGLTPFYLRYNSGLHISTNGKLLSQLIEKLVLNYPVPITEITLIGHSMGGLVFRSACHYGQKAKKNWVQQVKKVFYLGTPHLGTHLEKFGKLTTTVLNIIPHPLTKAIVFLGDMRSAGIKDLRHGYLTDEDWKKSNADHLFYWHQNQTPLLDHAQHYFICGTLSKKTNSKIGHFFGDGLVHTASGTARGKLSPHFKIIPGISHYHLQKSRRVYTHIRSFLV